MGEELASGGAALPWLDLAAFARRAIEVALADRETAPKTGVVFFDRGLVDAAAALEHATGEPALEELGHVHRYDRRVFLAPPWPEIYIADPERRHSYELAVAEFDRLVVAYTSLGYDLSLLPKVGVQARADFISAVLDGSP